MATATEAKTPKRRAPYPAEMRERSVRLVMDHLAEYPSRMKAIRSVATKMGVHWTTLHHWVKVAEQGGAAPALSADDAEELKRLRRENRELRRANEILKSASAFFARELDPGLPSR